MIYKVGLLGASGKMGAEIAAILRDEFSINGDHFELAEAVVGNSNLVSIEGVSTRRLEDPPREPVHVWIDFSRPEATVSHLKNCDTPIVIATTGFSEEQMAQVKEYSTKHPVLLAPNTSVGIHLFHRFIEAISPSASSSFDAHLYDEHHKNKKDAPSGTAKSLIEALKSAGFEEPEVVSSRLGGTRGIHSLRLVGQNETIEIRHEAFSRELFAEGALRAAAFLVHQDAPGLYGMKNVFEAQKTAGSHKP